MWYGFVFTSLMTWTPLRVLEVISNSSILIRFDVPLSVITIRKSPSVNDWPEATVSSFRLIALTPLPLNEVTGTSSVLYLKPRPRELW